MKAIKTMLIIALVAIFGAFQARADFRFGIKAGLNVNDMNFNKKVLDESNRCGFTAGVMTEFTVPLIGIGFDLSLMYTRMNAQQETYYDSNDHYIVEKFGKDFLEIPLNLKYKLSIPAVSSIIAPYIYTGPSLALKLSKGDDNFFKTKTAQWGWNLGLGVQLVKHLQIGAGYTWGINNVVKTLKVADGVASDVKAKNNYWTITAAYLF